MVQELPLEPLSLPGGGGVAAGPTHLERLEHMKEEVGVADPAKEQQQQQQHWDQLKPWESRLIISPPPSSAACDGGAAGGRAPPHTWGVRQEDYDEDSEDMEDGRPPGSNNGHPHLHDPHHHHHHLHNHHNPLGHPGHPHLHHRSVTVREFFEPPLSGPEEDHFGGGPYSVGSGGGPVQAGSSPVHDGGVGPPTPGGGGGSHAFSPDQMMQHIGGGGGMGDGGPAGSAAAAKKSTSRRNAWGNLSYADLITQAILSSPEKRLTLSQAAAAAVTHSLYNVYIP